MIDMTSETQNPGSREMFLDSVLKMEGRVWVVEGQESDSEDCRALWGPFETTPQYAPQVSIRKNTMHSEHVVAKDRKALNVSANGR